jgi:hypothetical protein
VDKDSKEAKKFVKDQEEAEKKAIKRPAAASGGGSGGLASIMNVISGKKTSHSYK